MPYLWVYQRCENTEKLNQIKVLGTVSKKSSIEFNVSSPKYNYKKLSHVMFKKPCKIALKKVYVRSTQTHMKQI